MKVFVAGGTGVLGRRAVPLLVQAGHEVTAAVRSEEKAALVRAMGAHPVRVDLFDAAAVTDAVRGHEAVVNLATHIPPMSQMTRTSAWAENGRIRREVSRNLVDAALAAGASRYVQESIAFMYADGGDAWLDEDASVDAPSYVQSSLAAEGQARRFSEQGRTGVALRFGGFYCPDSEQSRAMVRAGRAGIAAVMGSADGWFPWIDADDAAAAVVAALGAPAGLYNVVDEPLRRREQREVLARAVGVRRVVAPPAATARLGGETGSLLTRSQRVSNRRFREATGWAPRHPTVREGWPALVSAMGDGVRNAAGPIARLGLLLLSFTALQLGVWATVAPRSFFTTFPGGGRQWVAVDGPYNEHLVRDFGGLNLALAVVTIAALVLGTRAFVRTAAIAWLVWSVPHLVYHLRHLDVYDTGDKAANVFTLSLLVVVAVLLLVGHRFMRPAPATT